MAGENTSLRSVGWVSLCSLGQLVLQFWFQMLLAKHFGASWEMDAYVAAIALPTVIGSVLVGSLGYALVPLFGGLLVQDAGRAWRLAGGMAVILVALTTVAAMATFLLADWLVETLFPGFSEERAELAAALLKILCWLIVTNGLIGYLQSLYYCHKRFLLPAAASPIGIAVTVAGAIVFRHQGMLAVAWAVLAGSVTAVVLQSLLLLRHGRFSRVWNEDVRRCLGLLMPLVLGALYFRLDPLVDRYLTSPLPVGSVSHLGYAWRIASAMLLITAGGLSVVAFPNFSEHWAAGRRDEFRREVASAVRCLAVILVPIAFALLFYSEPLIADLLERGQFTAADSRAVGLLLVLYVGMIIGAGAGEITSKVFYSLSDTRTPTVLGVVTFSTGLILKIALVGRYGAAAVAGATSFYFLLSAALAAILIVRRLGSEVFSGIGGALGRSIVGSAAATAAAWPLVWLGFPLASMAGAAVGGVVYSVAMVLQRDEFALRMTAYVFPRHRIGK